MQDEMIEDSVLKEVEQSLSGMGRLEKLVLVVDSDVSFRWHYIAVTNCYCLSARHVIVTCAWVQVSPGVSVHTHVSKWRRCYL